ncbi:hypothetical protein C0995_005004, partial [Termitomyces sp. Mi166
MADDPDLDLWKFFPVCSHGNILITSQNEACTKYASENFYKVGEMTNEDSLAVLFKASTRINVFKSEHAAAQDLVEELGHLALAIVQAGGYLHHNWHIKFSQYLDQYKRNKPKYLAQIKVQNMDSYSLSVFATWDLSYQKLDKKAKQVLMLCSILHYSKIPMAIWEKIWNNFTEYAEIDQQEVEEVLKLFITEDGNWDDNGFEKALDGLQSYSLIEVTGEGVVLLEIHSLVHIWSYKSLSKKDEIKALTCAQQVFYCINREEKGYHDVIQWVPYVRVLLKMLIKDNINDKAADAMGKILKKAYLWDET